LLYILFFILPSSHLDIEEKKIPQPHLHENTQRGADDKPKTASEIGHFIKEDMDTLIVLYYLLQYLYYASYCIALEMEEINYLYFCILYPQLSNVIKSYIHHLGETVPLT
jgi:hypothetical protein